ncbi:hypothetical protein Tco_0912732 [Tanacetum coccineum]
MVAHEEELSSRDEKIISKKAFMAIADDEPSVGKNDARSGQWVEITMRKATNEHEKVIEDSTKSDESSPIGYETGHLLNYEHEPLPSLPKFKGDEPKGESEESGKAISHNQTSIVSCKNEKVA